MSFEPARRGTAIGGALLLGALTLLAMGLKELRLPSGSLPPPSVGTSSQEVLSLLPPWLVLVTVVLFVSAFVLLGVWVLQALLRRRRKAPDDLTHEQSRPGLLAQVLALLITALLLSGLIYGFYHLTRLTAPTLPLAGVKLPSRSSPQPPPGTPPSVLTPGVAPTASAGSKAMGMLRWALIAVGVLAALGLLLLQLKQKRAQTLTEAEGKQREELAARAGQAASELAHGGELEDVVLRCYRDMVAILTRQAEVSMTPEMTAREFAARLRALSLAEEPVDVLTALFERVRYGEETLGERCQNVHGLLS